MRKSFFEEILKNKEELLIKFLEVMEGKEARAKVNLDGVKFKVGKTDILLNGSVEFTVIPPKTKKK